MMSLFGLGMAYIATGIFEDDDAVQDQNGDTGGANGEPTGDTTGGAPDLLPDPLPSSDPIPVATNSTATGTSGNDIFDLIETADGVENASVTAGAGNDILDLFDETSNSTGPVDDRTIIGSVIDAGAGNDDLSALVWSSRVEMGDGDDTVTLLQESFDNIVNLGDGNDVFSGVGGSGPLTIVSGGDGNDTLSGRFNLDLRGDAGDDTIGFSGLVEGGTGYATLVDGGTGEDTISFTGSGITTVGDSALSARGGADGDLFVLDISEGDTANTRDFDAGVFEQEDGSLLFEVLNLPDFKPGQDLVQIDATPNGDGYDLTTARLEDGVNNGFAVSTLILRYEHASAPAQETTVIIGSPDVEWDDIRFVGQDIPTLVPLTPIGS